MYLGGPVAPNCTINKIKSSPGPTARTRILLHPSTQIAESSTIYVHPQTSQSSPCTPKSPTHPKHRCDKNPAFHVATPQTKPAPDIKSEAVQFPTPCLTSPKSTPPSYSNHVFSPTVHQHLAEISAERYAKHEKKSTNRHHPSSNQAISCRTGPPARSSVCKPSTSTPKPHSKGTPRAT